MGDVTFLQKTTAVPEGWEKITGYPGDCWVDLEGEFRDPSEVRLNNNVDVVDAMCCDADADERAANPKCICYENYNDFTGRPINPEVCNKIRIVCEVARDFRDAKEAEAETAAASPASAPAQGRRLIERFMRESTRCQQS